jgi:hypothetical protein
LPEKAGRIKDCQGEGFTTMADREDE